MSTQNRIRHRLLLAVSLTVAVVSVGAAAAGVNVAVHSAAGLTAAVVLPGQINDHSWNSVGYAGLKAVAKKYGAKIAYTENVTPSTQKAALTSFASKGYSLVFAHGGQYDTAVKGVAKQHPKTKFVTIAGTTGRKPNVNAFSVAFDQYFYVQGYLEAKLSKTHHIALITALQGLKTVQDSVSGWRVAAKLANPKTKTTVVYLQNNEDPAEAKAAAQAAISSGADVVVPSALNAGIQGVLQAAKQAKVWTSAEYQNLTSSAPEQIITNQIYNWDKLYTAAAKLYKAGRLNGVVVSLGYSKDPNAAGAKEVYDAKHMFNPRIPAAYIAQTRKIIAKLAAGKVKIPSTAKLAAPGTQ